MQSVILNVPDLFFSPNFRIRIHNYRPVDARICEKKNGANTLREYQILENFMFLLIITLIKEHRNTEICDQEKIVQNNQLDQAPRS